MKKVRKYFSLKGFKRVREMFTLRSTASKYLQVYDKLVK